jgi:hypothetical protein
MFEDESDLQIATRHHTQDERQKRNLAWLESHWGQLLPQARGHFLAVADEQAFIAESADAAWEWIDVNHPNDPGAFVQHVLAKPAVRIYANSRTMDSM